MTLLTVSPAGAALPGPAGIGAALAARPVAVAVLAFLCVLSPALLMHPADPGDPVEYYNAALCVSERLACAPHDHWSARWPIFAPTGLLFRLFGESRAVASLLPMLHAIATVALFTAVLQRLFGRPAALVGGLLFATTPIVSELALQLNADIVEISFLLGGVLALVCAREGRPAWLLALAGMLFALAVETRMTSVVAASLVGATLLCLRWPLRDVATVAAGGLFVLGASAAAHWVGAGDPLTVYRLSLAHTQVSTTELPAGIDTSGGPFFNLELIRNWKRSVSVHWLVDPPLNLLASVKMGGTLSLAALLILIGRASFRGDGFHARALRHLGLCSMVFLVAIVFGLSIHPTPRMFLPLLGAVVAMAALILSTTRTDLRAVVLMLFVPLLALGSLSLRWLTYDPIAVEQLAGSWIAQAGEVVATDRQTRRHLVRSAAVRALPEDAAAPLQLVIAPADCASSRRRQPGWRMWRQAPISTEVTMLAEVLSRVGYRTEAEQWSLCLYRNNAAAAPSA